MRVRIGGTPDAAWFLESGRRALSTIESATNAAAVELAEIDSALDFGCGVGRVLRWLKDCGLRLYGTDYDEEAVDWCRANLDFAEVCRNPLAPPLSFATNTFGLVYAFSVFTHLPVSLQALWLEELTRVTRSGGLLLMTTHGECYRGRLKGSERKTFDGGGVVVRRDQVAGTRVCSAFHPPAYVINTLAPYLDLVQHVPQGALGNPYQDLFVLRKPPG
jgi:SAM-dependent methyltransferase